MTDVKNKYNNRSSYSKEQQQILWHYYDKIEASKQNLNMAVKEEISRATNIPLTSIHSWFQYQRKIKRQVNAKAGSGVKSEATIDVDAFEPNSQMNASIIAKIQKYDALKSQVDFLLQQVEILKKDLDASKRDLDESNISLNDSGFDTSNNSLNNSGNGQFASSQETLQYNVQHQNVSQNIPNAQRFGFQNQPNGIPNVPNGPQNMPNGSQHLPNGGQNNSNGAQNLPNGFQNDGQNPPNGVQNLPNGMVYNMGYNMNPMFYNPSPPQQYGNHFNQMNYNGSIVKQEPMPYNMDQSNFIKAEPQY